MTDYTDEQIEALCQAATPGPWTVDAGSWGVGNAEFIAAARELVPALLARAREAEARLRAANSELAEAENARDALWYDRENVKAELAEAKAENERLRQVAQSDRETAADYADEVAAAHAERDEAKVGADELRRLLLDETYRPEGGEIVMRELNAARSERDAERRRADHNANAVNKNADMTVRLRAELAEANAEKEALRQVAQADRETAKDYADEVAAAHAERDRLAAQVAAVRALCDEVENRMMATVKPSEIRAALDGTEQDGAA